MPVQDPATDPQPQPAATPGPDAGFWKREIAWLIDALLLGAVVNLLLAIPVALLGIPAGERALALLWRVLDGGALPATEQLQALLWSLLHTLAVFAAASTALYALLGWPYFALFEASPRQATPGKQVLGIRVVDRAGARVSFARASARFFAAALSWLTLNLGHALAAWTPHKRALHDYIAGTRVCTVDASGAALPAWGRVLVVVQAALLLALPLLLLVLLLALLLLQGGG